MSTSSKPKSRAPAHPNTHGFRHNKNSSLTKKIQSTATTAGLCQRCSDKIEWRKKYRKYKPLSTPRKCNTCHEKKIRAAYRTICRDCGRSKHACQGCGQVGAVPELELTTEEQDRNSAIMESVVDGLRERDKRAVYRKVDKGESAIDAVSQYVDLVGDGTPDESSPVSQTPEDAATESSKN